MFNRFKNLLLTQMLKSKNTVLIRFDGCYNRKNYGCESMYLLCPDKTFVEFGDWGGGASRNTNYSIGLVFDENYKCLGIFKNISFLCGTICKQKINDLNIKLSKKLIQKFEKISDTAEVTYKKGVSYNFLTNRLNLGGPVNGKEQRL